VNPHEVRFTREAKNDFEKLTPKLKEKLKEIVINTIAKEPKAGKRLVGDLTGFYSVRLTYKDRIVYSIDDKARQIIIHRARTHYGE
jgi:Txe/YoeB family toxin of Txe-Axe toxin-antitoxin module